MAATRSSPRWLVRFLMVRSYRGLIIRGEQIMAGKPVSPFVHLVDRTGRAKAALVVASRASKDCLGLLRHDA